MANMQESGSTVVLKNVGDAHGENEIQCYARIEGCSGVVQVRTFHLLSCALTCANFVVDSSLLLQTFLRYCKS
jgi:hypothetical protein